MAGFLHRVKLLLKVESIFCEKKRKIYKQFLIVQKVPLFLKKTFLRIILQKK